MQRVTARKMKERRIEKEITVNWNRKLKNLDIKVLAKKYRIEVHILKSNLDRVLAGGAEVWRILLLHP